MTKAWFIFLLARHEDNITQSPLQLIGVIRLTSSQWDMMQNVEMMQATSRPEP